MGAFLKEKTLFGFIVLYFLGKINMDLAFTPHFFGIPFGRCIEFLWFSVKFTVEFRRAFLYNES